MKIVACVKQVLDPRGITVNRKAEKVFVNREEYRLDPASRAALQVAAEVKAAAAASNGAEPPEIIAISLGPDRVDDALREAMAFGADRAIHLKDAAFDQADAWVAASALAAAIRKIGEVDVILLGARSRDSGSGELAPRLAEALDLPALTDVASIQMNGDVAKIVHKYGDAFVRVEVKAPAVVAVSEVGDQSCLSQYPSGWRLMDAYRKWPVDAWCASDLALSAGELRPMTMKKEDAFPPERQLGARVKDADELATLLKRERVI
ncbi:MAG TPA: hypothetical protein VJG32_23825 [Anaerolineae bacterium]|nr:hypothetical protein [Anaerolineae bacterium]